jgi:SAM-dependent methyltransferase
VNIAEYQRMYEAEERHWWYIGMRAISFALLGDEPRAEAGRAPRILDAGCGTGTNLERLAARGTTVGLDLSDEALRFAKSRGVTVVRGDLHALPFRHGSFDAVTSFDVLYHLWVKDDAQAMAEMARVLRKGGVMLLRLPAFEALRRAHDDAVHTRHRYTRGEVRTLLERSGLELVRDSYCNTLLLPLVLLRSAFDTFFDNQASDLSALPRPVEWTFGKLLALEARLVRTGLPVGASVVALARKR